MTSLCLKPRTGGTMAPAKSADRRSYGALRRRLDANWWILRNRRFAASGEECTIDFVLLHRDYGIALVSLEPEEYAVPDLAIRIARAALAERGFAARFEGTLPIVFLTTGPQPGAELAARIARALGGEAALDIADPSWVEWVADVLAGDDLAAGGATENRFAWAANKATAPFREKPLLRLPLVRVAAGVIAGGILFLAGCGAMVLAGWRPAIEHAAEAAMPSAGTTAAPSAEVVIPSAWAAPMVATAEPTAEPVPVPPSSMTEASEPVPAPPVAAASEPDPEPSPPTEVAASEPEPEPPSPPETVAVLPQTKPPVLPPRDPRHAARRKPAPARLAEWVPPPPAASAPAVDPAPPPAKRERHWWERIPIEPAHITNDR
jgi:hypothetical protein